MCHLQFVHISADCHLLVSNNFIFHAWSIGVEFKPLESNVCHKMFIEKKLKSKAAVDILLQGDTEDWPLLIIYHVLYAYLGHNLYHQFRSPPTQCHLHVLVHVCTDKVTRGVSGANVASLMCINCCFDQYRLFGHYGGSCVSGYQLFALFPSIRACLTLHSPVPVNL